MLMPAGQEKGHLTNPKPEFSGNRADQREIGLRGLAWDSLKRKIETAIATLSLARETH